MRGKPYRIDNFSGGIDYRDGGRFINDSGRKPDERQGRQVLREALNVFCDENLVLRRRGGVLTTAAMNTQEYRAFHVMKNVNSTGFAIAKDLVALRFTGAVGVVEAFDTNLPSSPPNVITGAVTGTAQYGVFAEGQQVDGMGPLYALFDDGNIAAGAGLRLQWPGTGNMAAWTAKNGPNTAWTYRTTVPWGQFMLYFQSRMIVAGDTHSPTTGLNTVWWSDLPLYGGPRVWPTQNQVILDPDDGDIITGIAPSNQNVLVFKRSKIYVIYDLETGANRTISNDIGCIAAESICTTPMGTMFLDQNAGVCVTDGRTVTKLGEAILPAFDMKEDIFGGTVSAAAVYTNDHYIISGGISPILQTPLTYAYNTKQRSWWALSFYAFQYQVKSTGGRDQLWMLTKTQTAGTPEYAGGPAIPSAGNPAGQGIFWFDPKAASDGLSSGVSPVAFANEIRTPWLTFDEPYLRKRLRRVRLTGRGRLNVDVRRNYDDDVSYALAANGLGAAVRLTDSGVLDMPVSMQVGNSFSVRVAGVNDAFWAVNDLTAMVTGRTD